VYVAGVVLGLGSLGAGGDRCLAVALVGYRCLTCLFNGWLTMVGSLIDSACNLPQACFTNKLQRSGTRRTAVRARAVNRQSAMVER